jgi:NADPH-dependent stearoyl-CoA 9-desaturase
VTPDAWRERGGERVAQPVGLRGDLLRAFPGRRREFTAAVFEEEVTGLVSAPNAGTANFDAGPLLAFASGNLCYQIEHHLFPDLPSNRYAEIATRVRALYDKFDLPYTTGSLLG